MSQGALFKRFGSKHQLVAATAEHLFGRLVADFRNAMRAGQPADADDALGWIIRQLWAVFLKPELYAVTELYIAARTDEPLRQALVPVMWQHRQNLLTEARRLFPRAADENPHFEAAVDATMHAMQGAAMSVAVLRESGAIEGVAKTMRRMGEVAGEAGVRASAPRSPPALARWSPSPSTKRKRARTNSITPITVCSTAIGANCPGILSHSGIDFSSTG